MNYDSFFCGQARRPIANSRWKLWLVSTDDLIPKGLVVVFELFKLLQSLIKIHAEMGDDVSNIVWMCRIVLHDDAHDTSYKLNVRSERTEWSENRGNA